MASRSRPSAISPAPLASEAPARRPDVLTRPLGAGWLRLAIASLILAGLTSGLVALGRTPGLQALIGPQGFKIFLAGHVNFSLSVWCLGFTCAIWAVVADLHGRSVPEKAGRAALGLAWAGMAAMAVATVFAMGPPILVDYLPLIGHPVFGLGMILFFGGTGLMAIGFLVATGRQGERPTRLALARTPEVACLQVSAIALLFAMTALVLARTVGWQGSWAAAAWGGGHLLQVCNAATLVASWLLLLGNPALEARQPGATEAIPLDLRWLRRALPIYAIPCLGVPVLYLLPGDTPVALMGLLTWSAVAIPTVLALLLVGYRLIGQRRFDPPRHALLASLLLFAAGFGMAMLGMPGDTRVTAHYHGTVGAVTLAFMGLSYPMLARFGLRLRGSSWARVQPLIYGLGLLLLIAGLFWASNYGGQRKVFETFAHQKGLWGPLVFFGAGAIVGIVGGMAYIVVMGLSVFGPRRAPETAAVRTVVEPGETKARPAPLMVAMVLSLLLSGTALVSSYKLLAGPRPIASDRPEAPTFTLVDQRGREVALADLRGKPVLLTFLYTHCTTACPRILSSIRQALDRSGAPPGALEVVAVSVDPERDTPQRLAVFSRAFPPSWLFLSGEPARVARTWAAYKIAVERDEASGRRALAPAAENEPTGQAPGHAALAAHAEHTGHVGHVGDTAQARHAGHTGHAGQAAQEAEAPANSEAVDHSAHAMYLDQPMNHMGHVGYTVTHTNKVVVLDSHGRIAAEHSGTWTPDELAGSVTKVLSGAQGRLDSPILNAAREFLQRCGNFAVQNPLGFLGIVLAIMLPGIFLPVLLIRTLLASSRA